MVLVPSDYYGTILGLAKKYMIYNLQQRGLKAYFQQAEDEIRHCDHRIVKLLSSIFLWYGGLLCCLLLYTARWI